MTKRTVESRTSPSRSVPEITEPVRAHDTQPADTSTTEAVLDAIDKALAEAEPGDEGLLDGFGAALAALAQRLLGDCDVEADVNGLCPCGIEMSECRRANAGIPRVAIVFFG